MKNAKLSLYLVLGFAILAALTWLFLVPKVNEALETKKTIDSDKAKLVKLKSKLKDLESLNEYELTEKTNLSLKAVPKDKNFPEVLEIINKLALDNGMILEGIQVVPGNVSEIKDKSPVPYKIKLLGSIESLKTFITSTLSQLPLLDMDDKLQVDMSSEDGSTAFTLGTSSMPLPTNLGKIDAPVAKLTAEEEKALTIISQYSTLPVEEIATSSGRQNPFSF